MNRRYRKAYMIANWKMNKTSAETKSFAYEFKQKVSRVKWCDIVVCPPCVNISNAVKNFRDSRVSIGAQNLYFEESGAFTGEVTGEMLKSVGAGYVIVGHSERRRLFNETDEIVNKKVLAALNAGLRPIICLGETLREKEANAIEEYLCYQLKAALTGVPFNKIRKCIIAYEPIWAIGTGLSATPEHAQGVCELLRNTIRRMYDAKTARSMSILYGGSMNADNIVELLSQPDVDGGLVGGASLKPDSFAEMIQKVNQIAVQ